jgi:hypothetical protein
MTVDYRVPKRSDREIRQEAIAARPEYKTEHRRPVNVIRHLQSGWIPARGGRKTLVYNIIDDDQMGRDDGKTEFVEKKVGFLSTFSGRLQRDFGISITAPQIIQYLAAEFIASDLRDILFDINRFAK